METPDTVADAFSTGKPVIFVGLHFGDLELPSRFLVARVGQAVAPMETIGDPALQAYFERTRGANGVRIVGLREARRALLGALRDGISVGLVGDRDLTGGGAPVSLFQERLRPFRSARRCCRSRAAPRCTSSAFGGPVAVATGDGSKRSRCRPTVRAGSG